MSWNGMVVLRIVASPSALASLLRHTLLSGLRRSCTHSMIKPIYLVQIPNEKA